MKLDDLRLNGKTAKECRTAEQNESLERAFVRDIRFIYILIEKAILEGKSYVCTDKQLKKNVIQFFIEKGFVIYQDNDSDDGCLIYWDRLSR